MMELIDVLALLETARVQPDLETAIDEVMQILIDEIYGEGT